jgi:DNA-binding SARP family transcriptional activator
MIELRILGALELRSTDGRSVDDTLRRSKRTVLLAFLAAARPSGFHRRDKLVALFWPDLEKDRARGALRTTLSRLRDELGQDVIESRGTEEVSIRRDAIWCDVTALHEALDRGDAMAAAELYRGPMLDGVHVSGTSEELEHWLHVERDAIRRALLTALASASDRHAAATEFGPAVANARRACELAPDDELAARRLIRYSLAAGDRGAAVRAYESLEVVLQREYDVHPSTETTALIAALRPADRTDGATPAKSFARSGNADDVRRGAVVRLPRAALTWSSVIAVAIIAGLFAFRRLPSTDARAAESPWSTPKFMQAQFRGRIGSSAFIDSAGGLVVIGGMLPRDAGEPNEIRDEVWRIPSTDPRDIVGFSRVSVAGVERPRPRWLASSGYDAAHDRAILHGGAFGSTSPCGNDTWVMDDASGRARGAKWRRVTTRGETPPPHAGATGAFDVKRRRLLLFGGHDCLQTFFNDLWRLDFDNDSLTTGKWSRISADNAAGAPVPRNVMATWYDAAADRFFVYGGTVGSSATNDLWVLEGTNGDGRRAWRSVNCAGDSPPRSQQMAVYDASSGTVLMFGGIDAGANYRREMIKLSGLAGSSNACRWTTMTTTEPWPQARGRAHLLLDPRSSRLVLFGGEYQNTSFADLWVIESPFHR